MSDDFKLPRRKVLGALGGVGLASAGAGLGTSAYFSDTESFENNSLTAGELDLKIDWEEHYFGGRDENGSSEATIVRGDPNPTDVDYYLPAMNNPDADPIALNFENDQDALWDATTIEAFPDTGDASGDTADDGIRDGTVTCADLQSVDDALTSSDRTSGNDGDPLVQLGDVKPGDFGEVTFSFHLCDNPGYVWMQGELVEAAENGITEPEGDDKDEDGSDVTVTSTSDDDYGKIELLDEARARMWYDANCDNHIATGDVDVMMIVDDSVSSDDADQAALEAGVNEFVGGLSDDSEVGALTFGGGSVGNFEGLGSFSGTVPTGGGSGNTPLPPALDIAAQELEANGRDGAEKVIVVFTDGGPNYENKEYSAGGYTAPRSADYTLDTNTPDYDEGGGGNDANNRPGGISDGELEETAAVARKIRDDGVRIITVDIDVAGSPTDTVLDLPAYLRGEIASSQAYAKNVLLDDLAAVANDLAAVTMDEDLFFEGSLREALEALSSGRGIPLDGDTSTPLNEFMGSVPNLDDDSEEEFPDEAATDGNRDCFPGGDTNHCVGFEWWLPVDHANQIQGDSVEFNLGFYTEQCRHNDGSGQ